MNKKIVAFISFMILVGCGVLGCKANSDEPFAGLHQTGMQYGEEEGDCLAWKFTLAAALHMEIEQENIRYLNRKRQKEWDVRGFYHLPKTHVDKLLPARTARKIINTIIEREGGICSRELLYDTPCFSNGQRGRGYASTLVGDMKFKYFSSITGIPVDPSSLSQLDAFLRDHISKSPHTKARYREISCKGSCTDVFRYALYNSFGICMFKKYQNYLKDQNIFDLTPYDYGANYWYNIIDEESLRSFIQRSHEIAEENRQRSEQAE